MDTLTPNKPSCPVCLDLTQAVLQKQSTKVGSYFQGLKELIASAEHCITCNILLKATRHCYPEIFVVPALFETDDDPLSMVKGGWKKRVLNIYATPGKPCPWPLLAPGNDISSDPQLLAEQVTLWVDDCERNHPECHNPIQGTLPKRVVQILPGSKPGSCKVRLYEPSAAERGRYVGLSHCWGKHQIIVTKKETVEKHRIEIPWAELSRTFQNAIDFTCRLGIQFIWIDSLCIIQNSKEDWEAEAVKMAAYYANAHVTIAATAASDGTVGLFPLAAETNKPLELEGVDAQGRPYHLIARASIDHPFEVDQENLYEFPLMTRGWVYQEHVLSRRFLHFAPKEIIWECHSKTSCQCGMIPSNSRSDYTTNQVLSVAKTGLETLDSGGRRKLWYENVESIMNLDFTFVKDRLPAAAGVASRLAKGFKGRYLAGLWEENLVADLCWVIHDDGQRPKELEDVPSWSWGSVSGGLAMLWCSKDLAGDGTTLTAKVVGIDCQPEPPSFIGLLTRGILTLKGRAVKATFKSDHGVNKEPMILSFNEDKNPAGTLRGWLFRPDVTGMAMRDDVCLLEMMSRCEGGKKVSGVYLVLQPSRNSNEPYRRVGLLSADGRGWRGRQIGSDVSFLERFERVAQLTTVDIS
ncbi:hypothetical protein G7046_g6189 [Stylonectria norvegica]|nr:hypothetical protein G7046_g6189 [Stylonectria norvegica]